MFFFHFLKKKLSSWEIFPQEKKPCTRLVENSPHKRKQLRPWNLIRNLKLPVASDYIYMDCPSCMRSYMDRPSNMIRNLKLPQLDLQPIIIIWPFHATLVVTKLARTPQRFKKKSCKNYTCKDCLSLTHNCMIKSAKKD
jgi:hypothetical protein